MPIEDYKTIALDTMLFIYYFEAKHHFTPKIEQLLKKIEGGGIKGVTTVITLSEILVKPLTEGNIELADEYKNIINSFPNLYVLEINQQLAVLGANLKAKYNIKLPDALQMAGGLFGGAQAFVTNDKKLLKIEEIKVLTLDQL
ncbi:PIN domain nuclease [Candidatus Saganbacteria bacterium CG08_land_8_20_14_0_20_45_16]|uniref:PIN domain nuclease n=1 Tax=Candidatus Saganbacteria bacterium CG08_land_8_20_14_0_20_45_16 TaxID=2014293 RepID=A0A2H0Y3W4_UNCSA|nr:MAG: PIN domain nuclease [Candidatus Saganbacteria bacterium CG08_land_8_20_14_0_20_45_16]